MVSPLVIIPTYNEAENLAPLVERVLDLPEGFSVLVADDNSPDGTGHVADGLGARYPGRVEVLHRPGKQGLGAAYLHGFRIGLERGYRYLFQMDADFSHDPADLSRLFDALHRGADLVIGSRYVSGGGTRNWPRWRQAMSQGGSFYARTVLGLPIRDLTGGFRGWRRRILLALDLPSVRSEGYAFQVEMAFRGARRGARVVEVPIQFTERRSGKSKMSSAIFVEAALMVWRLRLEDAGLPRALRQVLTGR